MLPKSFGSAQLFLIVCCLGYAAASDWTVLDVDYAGHQYINIWGNDPLGVPAPGSVCPGGHHGLGRLDSPQAWSAQRNQAGEWFQMDAGSLQPVAGVVTTGRRPCNNRWWNQFVTSFYVSVSADGVNWEDVTVDGTLGGARATFSSGSAGSGNHGAYLEPPPAAGFDNNMFFNPFARTYEAQFVRIVVLTWQNHVSLRAGLLISTADEECTPAEASACSENAYCWKDQAAPFPRPPICTCRAGFEDNSDGEGLVCDDIKECSADPPLCHVRAWCEELPGTYQCGCFEGFLGDGVTKCDRGSWTVRTVLDFTGAALPADMDAAKTAYTEALMPGSSFGAEDDVIVTMVVEASELGDTLTFFALFETDTIANGIVDALDLDTLDFSGTGAVGIIDGPGVYRWEGGSTSSEIPVKPSGMEVEAVHFKTNCLASGCWVIDVIYTIGTDDFNTFFIPEAVGNEQQSYDFDYTTLDSDNGGVWPQSPAQTFLPNTHPCTTADFNAADGLLAQTSSCCLDQFFAMYRPIAGFVTAVSGDTGSNCGTGPRNRPLNAADVRQFAIGDLAGDGTAAAGVYVDGVFSGSEGGGITSYGESRGVVDPYVGIYKARFYLDEVETRKYAGQLRGTVGVEHTVDTFIGFINLSPTPTYSLDTFATQTALHFEKTSFFSVSTHGTNDYTFLEYVNLRLIAVYIEDDDFSGSSGSRTERTDDADQINYVQVTFTLGSQYKVDEDYENFPLIPLDSVRAGYGTFFDDALDLTQKCSIHDDGALDFDDSLLTAQPCAPNAQMCVSPQSIDDSFVSFNIPLGTDYFETAGGPSATLSNNIFVDMVISAVEDTAGIPNQGDAPEQMKTTLTASIPIVEGGINIFCDGFTAKTDLKDVANADIVVGSASSAEELTRLRIVSDVASTDLDQRGNIQIDSDSIEAGLMTLVLKGNASYFAGTNTGRAEVTIELEDVITIHIMEDDGSGGDINGEAQTAKGVEVERLLAIPAQDSSLGGDLDTDGYSLNGAFSFTIDRDAQRAHLEPSPALLAECPFNPPRPDPSAVPLETCVTRRDVRYRGFPARTGAKSTAMEICVGGTCPGEDSEGSVEAAFFETIFGENEFARKLGSNYARTIDGRYRLNGRFRRAYYINPGYEWTPTQTGGTPIFSVSQKLYLFALITLDEGIDGVSDGMPGVAPTLRRMLLQSTPSNVDEALQDGQSSVGSQVFEFQTTPTQMMAKAFNVPIDRVATFSVKVQLTQTEACMSNTELQLALRSTMEDYLEGSASPFHTAQITKLSVDAAGVQCARRSMRSLLSSFSDATAEVTMLVVFKEGQDSVISLAKLGNMAGVLSVEPLVVSPKVSTAVDASYVPPPSVSPSDGGSSSNTAVIAGAAGGCVAVIMVIAGLVYYMRKRKNPDVVQAVQTINVEDLKSQIANEV